MLKILLLEDHANDAELIKLELSKLNDKYELKCVEDLDSFLKALENYKPDLILSDLNIPGYSGSQALKDTRELLPEASVMVVTGSISGEEALEYVVDLGAKDYILKSDLRRLMPAVTREIEHQELNKIRIEQEEELKQTKRFHQLALKGAQVGIWELDLETNETIFNDIYYKMLGYERAEVEFSKRFHDRVIHPKDRIMIDNFMMEIMNGERNGFEATIRMKSKNGKYRHIMDRAQVVEWHPDGKPSKLAGSHIDITRYIDIEENLLSSYREKEVLLQEIHHRVKNNLAIVSGLLWLEMDDLPEALSVLPLSRSINRIQSMSKVHELLYNSENLSQINIKDYIEEMSELIVGNANLPHEVQVKLSVEDCEININEMVPLGLLLNELITNSLKYAFPKEGGEIFIDFSLKDDKHHLSYRDTGPGMIADLDLEDTNTLGMKIISVLLKQLDATYMLNTHGQFYLDFSFNSKHRGAHSNL